MFISPIIFLKAFVHRCFERVEMMFISPYSLPFPSKSSPIFWRDTWEMREGCEKPLIVQIPSVYSGFERFVERWELFCKSCQIMPDKALSFSTLDAIFPKLGNVFSPKLECFVPNREHCVPLKGTLRSQNGNTTLQIEKNKNLFVCFRINTYLCHGFGGKSGFDALAYYFALYRRRLENFFWNSSI